MMTCAKSLQRIAEDMLEQGIARKAKRPRKLDVFNDSWSEC